MGRYILGRLKDKFGVDEQKEQEGFPDMNYIVGNTTGKDIGGEPKVLHRRVGRFAQLGGEVAEVLIDNPATFQVEREGLLNVLEQLNIDASFHGDANLGFTAAYATRAQGVNYGYNLAHQYFTRYLEQLASFKSVVDSGDYRFKTSYVNMHASTAQAPPLEEQIPSDKVMDPFGYPLSNVTDGKEVNIYANKDFMERIVEFLLIPYVRDVEIYQGLSQIDDDFEERWRDRKEDELDREWNKLDREDDELVTKASIVRNSVQVDREIDYAFSKRADEIDIGPIEPEGNLEELPEQPRDFESLGDIFQGVGNLVRRIKKVREDKKIRRETAVAEILYDLEDDYEEIESKLESLLDDLWDEGLNFEAKQSSIVNTLDDLTGEDILENAAGEEVREIAGKALACRDEFGGEPPEKFQKFLESTRAGRQVERELEKESTAYYRILPIWLKHAHKDFGEKHPGWEELELLWDTIVGRNGDYRGNFESRETFREELSDDKDFRSDITAVVGSTYMWGHFTQRLTNFQSDKPRGPEKWEGDVEEWTSEHGDWTWVEYMNRYGLTVNIESMYGDPSSILRLWRPKDIAAACRAVNRTARKHYENEWDQDEYRGPFCKFTIDLEHTASFGVDPEREMELFFEQERELAKEGIIDAAPEKAASDILKTYHLTKPGFEQTGGVGHRHGPFSRGDTVLYRYLYNLVEAGFCRGEDPGIVMFEIGGDYQEEIYMIRIAMNMIELGIKPEEVKAENVDPSKDEYEDEREALLARFFGMDQPNYDREWAKIEEHAFDPLDGLLEAEGFDYTYSGNAALEEGGNRPQEWKEEEYQ